MNFIDRIWGGIINRYRIVLKRLLTRYFRMKIGERKFCIISNDCWGAEVYKLLKRPFNTPFIGLMLMSPCYLKLLENPKYYVGLPLNFKKDSKYASMQKLKAGISFPLGMLGDTGIEIQFLHYASEDIAREKWERRVKRIDWDNLFIKYDCGKDYADKHSVEKFLSLPYEHKLVFGKEDFGRKEVYVIKNYSLDAVVQFRNCFLNFNPVKWLSGSTLFQNRISTVMSKMAFKVL